MRIVFMGTPDFAVPPLEALAGAGHDIVGVFTQPDKPRGRSMKLIPSPVKKAATLHGITVYQPASLRKGEDAEKAFATSTHHFYRNTAVPRPFSASSSTASKKPA